MGGYRSRHKERQMEIDQRILDHEGGMNFIDKSLGSHIVIIVRR
jgi:hypothetical protein